MRIKDTDSVLYHAGQNQNADSEVPGDDIAGKPKPTGSNPVSIGAFEYVTPETALQFSGLANGESDTSAPALTVQRQISRSSATILSILRPFNGISIGESDTSLANLLISNAVQFSGLASGESLTSDAALTVARQISGLGAGESLTPDDVVLSILLQFSGSVIGESLTSDAILIIGGLDAILNPSIISATLSMAIQSVTPLRTIQKVGDDD